MNLSLFELEASFLRDISHPHRLEIINLLRDHELAVTDIYTMLSLSQGTISQHLKVLRAAAVVRYRKEGKQIFYSLQSKKIVAVCDLLRLVIADIDPETSDLVLPTSLEELTPLATDCVCGMRISTKDSHFSHEFHNKKYYFCASGCLAAFRADPEKYAK